MILQSLHQFLKEDPSYILVKEKEPLKEECKHFLDVVNKEIQPLTCAEEGKRVLNVLSMASDSIIAKEVIKCQVN